MKIKFFLVFLLLVPQLAFGYIDPGTGSLAVSALLGIGTTILFSIKGFFYKISSLITGKKIKLENDFEGKLVFFNEGKNYWAVFKPIIDELVKREVSFVYFTADKEDPGLKFKSPYFEKYYLGEIKHAILFLNKLKAKLVVMTTPQLNIMDLKRSKEVKHYSHLLHTATDIHLYKKFAFDYFDSVLCSSNFQIENIRQLERDRGTRKKQLFKSGFAYYDNLKDEVLEGEYVVLAPTWGEKTFMNSHGKRLLRTLLDAGHKVIFRPHPQSWISDVKLLEEINKEFEGEDNFTLDKSPDNNSTLQKAKFLICDISGIIYDLIFVYKKIVIAVDSGVSLKGYEGYTVEKEDSAMILLEDAGKFIKTSELENINSILEKLSKKKISQSMIDKHIFNFRNASKITTDHILSIYEGLK